MYLYEQIGEYTYNMITEFNMESELVKHLKENRQYQVKFIKFEFLK